MKNINTLNPQDLIFAFAVVPSPFFRSLLPATTKFGAPCLWFDLEAENAAEYTGISPLNELEQRWRFFNT